MKAAYSWPDLESAHSDRLDGVLIEALRLYYMASIKRIYIARIRKTPNPISPSLITGGGPSRLEMRMLSDLMADIVGMRLGIS